MTEKQPDLFKKLKRHFVLNAVLLSTGVIIIAFSMIYTIVSRSYADRRPVEITFKIRPDDEGLNEQVQDFFEERLRDERAESLETLLFTLIVTGFSIEIIVIIASLIAAENAIKPVREAYEAQKTFISNASHEIKTPLAVIQASLEAADIKGNHWLDNAAQKVEEAVELNNSLLTLARMDQLSVTPAKKSNVSLAKLVAKTADFYAPKMTERGITFTFKAPDNLPTIPLAKSDFTQLLNILLDNAVKYADKSIAISVTKTQVKITNDGTTIEPDKLKHIFERFYQTDKSKPGVGLGLSIAKSLADKNHWSLTANSDASTTTFALKLA